jgi:hypothetical protein
MKEKPILNNPDISPDQGILQEALKDRMILYTDLIGALTSAPLGLTHEWRYYRDGKAWLCKVVDRKKTILWLSVFDGYFKVAFYFSAKAGEGIGQLAIDDRLKVAFQKAAFIGKVKPLIIHVLDSTQAEDVLCIAAFRKKN